MKGTLSKVYMIREGKHVMTVYDKKKTPYVIGFRNYVDAKKAMFEIDTRYTNKYHKMIDNQLKIMKKPCVQFGSLHIDEVEFNKFIDYIDRPQEPKLSIVNKLNTDNKEYLLFDCVNSE